MRLIDSPSPNHSERPPGTAVDTIVLHATVFGSADDVCRHFEKSEPGVSSHYTIDRDGTIYSHVDECFAAHHAGVSRMPDGRERVNEFSIGIELVNRNDGVDPYPLLQLEVMRQLLGDIRSRHSLTYLVGHFEIAIPDGRKSDPRGLDLYALREEFDLCL